MPICSLLSSSVFVVIYHNLPAFLAILIGVLVFALALPDRLLVGVLALAAPAMMFILKLADMMSTADRFHDWACALVFQMGFFGSPVLFTCLAMIIGFSKLRKRKRVLLLSSLAGLIASVTHTILLLKAFAQME